MTTPEQAIVVTEVEHRSMTSSFAFRVHGTIGSQLVTSDWLAIPATDLLDTLSALALAAYRAFPEQLSEAMGSPTNP